MSERQCFNCGAFLEPQDRSCGSCGKMQPDAIERVLRDQSIIVSRDAEVFAKIAEWQNASSDTASADLPAPAEEEGT